MKILLVNKYHYYRAGPETVYLRTAELLKSHGHEIVFFSMHHPENLSCETDEFFVPYVELTAQHSILNQIKIAGRILYSFKAKRNLSNLLDRYPVEIAHLHDIGYHISPSILHELKKRSIPVVMTLHNLKMVCASYHMFADGKICEECRNGRYYMAIRNRCVKNSLVKSILAVSEMYLHHRMLDIYDNVDIFIAPSLFLRKKLEEKEFKKRIIHLPNFFDLHKSERIDKEERVNGGKKNTIVYIGRLSHEKGLITLLNAAKHIGNKGKKIQINIIGAGPLMNELQKKIEIEKINNVQFLGYMKHENLYKEIRKSLAVVLPSECYENNPLAVVEAFALGKPVIGSRRGGIPELVKDYERGLTFEPGNPEDLISKIEYLVDNPDKAEIMGEKARIFVEKELNSEKYYQELMIIYKQALKTKK
ncbi:MAG: group 1 glycosyl transferase [Candidatus Levybacteria bacterium RBG_16_35_11]|nr:MAG: group 1 glycosyl transferase [Candidatus Levybacteria bacterium RBG_16_35_11]